MKSREVFRDVGSKRWLSQSCKQRLIERRAALQTSVFCSPSMTLKRNTSREGEQRERGGGGGLGWAVIAGKQISH